jgi:ketosteroid isomerase-like protein
MSESEDQVRRVLADLTEAIRDKDATAVIALLADGEVTFDLAPPLRMEPERTHDPVPLEEWFGTWQGPIVSEPEVACGGDVAYAFGLQHMAGTKETGEEVDLWFRATACLHNEDGRWRITHMHNSVPFAMDGSDTALLDLDP